mmetsp:Transcript_16458/g.42224  ORF Transcript_16458/g.42224 Transcript_16458/m.42224 type:complete len:103 (+) Transcript_16458:196-504(+)
MLIACTYACMSSRRCRDLRNVRHRNCITPCVFEENNDFIIPTATFAAQRERQRRAAICIKRVTASPMFQQQFDDLSIARLDGLVQRGPPSGVTLADVGACID